MRFPWLALAGLLVVTPALPAQQPPQPQPPAATLDPRNRLDALLMQWEQKMKGLETLAAACTRTTKDKTYQTQEVFEGIAKYMKPNLALLDMKKQNKPDVYEKYICTGTFLYEFVPQSKTVRIHELPPTQRGQLSDDSFLGFLFGMRAEEAKSRYDLKLSQEDRNWIYIDIYPRALGDKADFQRAQLVLSQNTFLPRRLWFEQPNGNEVTWEMPQVQANSPSVTRNDFLQPQLPKDWTPMRVPRPTADVAPRSQARPHEVPPRVVRPNQ
jgi:TIGR03009 family protein